MKKQTIGKRKLQAIQTKNKIFEMAKQLFEENGINNVSISDIVEAAGVSTGTFYLYFVSKDQIISEIYLGEDSFYENLMDSLTAKTPYEKIIEYFDKSSAHIAANGIEIVKQLYVPTSDKIQGGIPENFGAVQGIVQDGQDCGLFSADISAAEITTYLFTLTSGIIFEWCLNNGDFDLRERTRQFVGYGLQAFLGEKRA